jgi:glycosyltransferase involved in cell wall biosynthesis
MDAHQPPHADPLTVALLSPSWPADLLPNGVLSYTATVSSALRELDVDCHVLAVRDVKGELPSYVHRVKLDSSGLWWRLRRRLDIDGWPQRSWSARVLDELSKLQANHRVELLELEEAWGWAKFMAPKCPVPLVVRVHGPWFLNGAVNGARIDDSFRRRDRWECEGVAAAAAVSAPSKDVLDRMLARVRDLALEPPAIAEVIPNPVEEVASQNRWTLEGCERRRILFVGRFDRHKGGDLILAAFASVLQRFPDALLDFAGPDRNFTDDRGRAWRFDEYLAAKLPRPQDRDRVTFHNFVPGRQLSGLRKRAMLTVVPSRYETFGIAAAEAMMSGCPIVAADAGALPELVQNDCNGLLAKAGDAEELADKILALLNDPARAQRLGRQAALDARDRYAPRVVAEKMIEFYRRVLGRGGDVTSPGPRQSVAV